MKNNITQTVKIIILALIVGTSASYILADTWTGPAGAPPGSNTYPPINMGGVMQTKAGSLGILGSFSADLNSSFGGRVSVATNAHTAGDVMNVGTTGRDSSSMTLISTNGTLEFEHVKSGASFIRSFMAGRGLGGNLSLTTGGNANAGITITGDGAGGARVGVGMATPANALDVNGEVHATQDICTDLGGGKCLSTVGSSSTGGSAITLVGAVGTQQSGTVLSGTTSKIITLNGTASRDGDNGPVGGYIWAGGSNFTIFSLGYNFINGTLTTSWQCASKATTPFAEGDFCIRSRRGDIDIATGPNVIITYVVQS